MKARQSLRSVFGRNLHRIRLAQNLSQEKLAELAGLHRTYVGSVERGERNVSIDAIASFAKALKVPIAELFDGGQAK